MDILGNLALGFSVALTPENLAFCFLGVLLGTLIGVLPGIGTFATIALLLPLTFSLPTNAALIMLAGIYYGAQYGGSTTAILVNIPGEASSVVTCLDGHQMARQGRAGKALAVAALGSFFAGCVGTLAIALVGPQLSAIAVEFGSPEYFSLMVLGLVAAIVLARGSLLKAAGMVVIGLLLALVGTDVNSGLDRYTFGVNGLVDGVGLVVVAAGMFGVAEILVNLQGGERREVIASWSDGLMPTRADLREASAPVVRGSLIGSVLGVLPGAGAAMAAFASYATEKRLARDPDRFGKGAIEGVAGPESANNAAAQTSFIPTLTLGIPGNAVMALMLGAMVLHGIVPGPQVMTANPDLFWGLIASMWIGNLMLVVLNLPLVGLWVRLLQVPYSVLFPTVLLLMAVGTYTIASSTFDILLMGLFGLVGYALIKMDCEPAPLLLGLILGGPMEENLRRSLVLSRGDPTVFLDHPLSLTMLVVAFLLLCLVVAPRFRRQRETVFLS